MSICQSRVTMETLRMDSQGFQVLTLDQGICIQLINLIHTYLSCALDTNPKGPRIRVSMREQGQGFRMTKVYLCCQGFQRSIPISTISTTNLRTIHLTNPYNISCRTLNKICHTFLKVTYLCRSGLLFQMPRSLRRFPSRCASTQDILHCIYLLIFSCFRINILLLFCLFISDVQIQRTIYNDIPFTQEFLDVSKMLTMIVKKTYLVVSYSCDNNPLP